MAFDFSEGLASAMRMAFDPQAKMGVEFGHKLIEQQTISLDKEKTEFVDSLIARLKKLKAETPVDDDAVAYYQKLIKKYQS